MVLKPFNSLFSLCHVTERGKSRINHAFSVTENIRERQLLYAFLKEITLFLKKSLLLSSYVRTPVVYIYIVTKHFFFLVLRRGIKKRDFVIMGSLCRSGRIFVITLKFLSHVTGQNFRSF